MGVIRAPPDAALLNPIFDKQLLTVLSAISPEAATSAWVDADETGLLLAYHTSQSSRAKAIATIRAAPAAQRLRLLREHAAPRDRGRGEGRHKTGVKWKLDYVAGAAVATIHDGEQQRVVTLHAGAVLALLRRLRPADLQLLGVDGGAGSLTGLVASDVPVLPTPMRPTGVRDGRPMFHAWSHAINRIAGGLENAAVAGVTPEARLAHIAAAQEAFVTMVDPRVVSVRAANRRQVTPAAHQVRAKGDTWGHMGGRASPSLHP